MGEACRAALRGAVASYSRVLNILYKYKTSKKYTFSPNLDSMYDISYRLLSME